MAGSGGPAPEWCGWIVGFTPDELGPGHTAAAAARRCDWDAVFRRLGDEPNIVNMWRPDDSSWFAPLHHAASNRASVEVVERLIAHGAWRTLRTADGETAQEIAVRMRHVELVDPLAPVVSEPLPGEVCRALDEHLAALIEQRIRPDLTVRLRAPATEVLEEIPGRTLWFPVPRMYGGFLVRLVGRSLEVESWSRVVDGSGQRHVITVEGSTLVEEGFV